MWHGTRKPSKNYRLAGIELIRIQLIFESKKMFLNKRLHNTSLKHFNSLIMFPYGVSRFW